MRKLIVLFGLMLTLAATAAPAAAAPLTSTITHLYTATAVVSRPHPTTNQVETITARLLDHGKAVSGALMTTRWYYKTTTSSCSGVTLASGRASCSRSISHATSGYAVRVTITFTKAGKVLTSTSTRFVPASKSGSNTGGTSTGGASSGSSGARTGATCRDGSHSYATGSGACSHHGGVAVWLYGP